jgi:hypothetical protein
MFLFSEGRERAGVGFRQRASDQYPMSCGDRFRDLLLSSFSLSKQGAHSRMWVRRRIC